MKPIASRAAFAAAALLCLFVLVQTSLAIPANPEPFKVRQPNGVEITLRMRGDEWFSWRETMDGRPVLHDEKTGFWVYAKKAGNGDLVPTGKRVGADAPDTQPFEVKPNDRQKEKIKKQQEVASRSAAASSGTGLVPVILANFVDTTPTVSANTLSNLLFSTATGAKSMATYYSEVSYGQFTVAAGPSGVQNWVTVPNTQAFYGGNLGNWKDTNAALFIRHAVQAAISAGYDFGPYDQDGDGKVDVVNVVHAGPGEENGAPAATIWSHRFSLSDAGLTPVTTPSGLVVDDYVIQPELRGNGSSTLPVTVGVFVHEHGHALGLPDLYDNDYSSCGIGNWSGMSFGANLLSGTTPAHFDPWCKAKLGWLTPINYTLNYPDVQFPHAAGTPFAARLWKDGIVGSQYYLIENRYRTNFDAALPGDGLLIWHIDETKTGNPREWYPISVGGAPANTNNGNFLVRLVQADGLFQMDITNKNGTLPVSARQNQGDSGDPFPGSSDNRVFGTNTWPNSFSYNSGTTPGYNSYVVVSNISNPGPVMTADIYTRSPNSGPYVEWRNIAGIVPPYEWATFSKLGEYNPVVVKALPGVVGTPLKQMQLYINRSTDGRWWDFSTHTWITNAVSSNVDISGVAQNGLTLAYQNNLPTGTNLVNGVHTFIVRVINTSDIVTELQMPMIAAHQPEVTLSLNDNAIVNTLTNFTAVATEDSGLGIQRVEIALYYDTEAHDIGTANRWYWDGYNWTTTPLWLGADFNGNPAQATLSYPIGPDASSLVPARQYYIVAKAIDGFGTEATNQVSVMFDTGTPPTSYWRYSSSGNWFDPANWIPYGVPGPSSHVAINAPGDYTVNVAGGNANVASLRVGRAIGLSKQQLVIPSTGSLTVNGADTNKFFSSAVFTQGGNFYANEVRFHPSSRWQWTNATFSARAHLEVSSALTIEGNNDKYFTGSFLLNRGTVLWRDSGNILGSSGAVITNTGLFSIEANAYLHYNNSGNYTHFINGPFGVIRKTTATTTSFHPDYTGWSFANHGTVDIRAGMLLLRNGSKVFYGGVISGAGLVRSEGGMLTLGGTTTFSSGTVQLSGDMNGSGGFNGAGSFDWQAGAIQGSARITNGSSVVLKISPGGNKWFGGNSIIQQNGPTIVTESGTVVMSQGSVFYNAGLFQIQTNTTFYYDNSGNYPWFVNQPEGTIVKSGPGVANFHYDYTGIKLSNAGLLDVQGGMLRLGGGGGPSSGQFNVASASAIEFTSETQVLTNGASITGDGVIRLLGGRVNGNSGPGTIAVDGTLEVSTNGTLGGSATWSGAGALNWTGGRIDGAAKIGPALTMNISGSAERWLEYGYLDNAGTINWVGDATLITGYGGNITNRNLFHLQGTGRFYYNNGGAYTVFCNEPGAVLRKSGSGTFTFWPDYTGVALHNRGTLDLQGGLLLLRNGTKVFYEGSTITGPARVKNAEGYLSMNGTVALGGSVVEHAADMGGQGGFTGAGLFEWSAGTIGNGSRLTNGANVQLQITPGGGKLFTAGSIIHQHGPTAVTDPGYVVFSQGSVFNNAGVFQVLTNTTFYYNNSGDYPWFKNLPGATFVKATTNTVFFHHDYSGIKFENDGLIHAQAGVLRLGGGGGPSSGEFHAESGAAIELVWQTHTLASSARMSGDGVTRLLGGGASLDTPTGAVTVDGTFEVSTNGYLGGVGRFVGSGVINWNAGRIEAAMTLSSNVTMNILGSAQRWFEYGRIINEATINWLDNGELFMNNGAILTNKALFHAQGSGVVQYNNSGGVPVFHNEAGATLLKTGNTTNVLGANYSGIHFRNRGTIDVQQGMFLLQNHTKLLENGGTITGAGRLKTSGGLLNFGGTTTLNGILELAGDMAGAGEFNGSGFFDWTSGAVYSTQWTNGANVKLLISPGGGKWFGGYSTLRQNGSTIVTEPNGMTISQGAVFNNAGLFDIRTNTTFYYDNSGAYPAFNNLETGTMRRSGGGGAAAFHANYGGITFNNAGTIDLQVGSFEVNGPNTMAASARHIITLGSTNDYARASFGGAATLNGAMTVTLTNGFVPAEGNSFSIVTYGSRTGQFSTPTLPSLPYPLRWKVAYGSNALTLTAEKAYVLTSPNAPSNGQFTLDFSGPAASSAILQTSTNLVTWLSVETNAPFTGTFQFTDADATATNKFYRVLIEP